MEYELIAENDPEKAMDKVKETGPDLVLLDLAMPKKNGLQVLDELKKDAKTLAIPVIMLTAVDSEEIRHKALHHDAVGYIIKPASFDEMKNKIESVLKDRGDI